MLRGFAKASEGKRNSTIYISKLPSNITRLIFSTTPENLYHHHARKRPLPKHLII